MNTIQTIVLLLHSLFRVIGATLRLPATRAATATLALAAAHVPALVAPALAQSDLRFGLPIACTLGETCWIQQYADHDSSEAAADYTCGGQAYDGHDGTDIRIKSTTDRADVMASAAGTVIGGRDGMADRLLRTDADKKSVANRECGNGVLIDHGGGWQTQYCHMRVGSIAVKKGQKVEAAQKLGEVGFSGAVQFPHIHLTVRKDGKVIDPFSGPMAGACADADTSIWTDEAKSALAYAPGNILDVAFASNKVDLADLEEGRIRGATPQADWPALVAYAWSINLLKGDDISITLIGPEGEIAAHTETLDRNKAQYLVMAGKKRPEAGWPTGAYEARVKVTNAGKIRIEKNLPVKLE